MMKSPSPRKRRRYRTRATVLVVNASALMYRGHSVKPVNPLNTMSDLQLYAILTADFGKVFTDSAWTPLTKGMRVFVWSENAIRAVCKMNNWKPTYL